MLARSLMKRLVHRVGFFRPAPQAGQCLAYCADSGLLALSREGGDIEVWDVLQACAVLRRRFYADEETSVESLAFARPKRLFSCGLHGLVVEHDLDSLSTRRKYAVSASGPAWCIEYNAKSARLAVGTEDGQVSLYKVTPDEEEIDFDKTLDKQDGRILCLVWHKSGDYLATGSPDTIRFWDTRSGHVLRRMATGRDEKFRETIVWSVALTDDFTIVSGDSRGKTCFWDAKVGALNDAYQSHKADILAVCLNKDQNLAIAVGADPTMVHFQPLAQQQHRRRRWVKAMHRSLHTHDVRAAIFLHDNHFLASVGVDAALALGNIRTKTTALYPPLETTANPSVALAPQANVILLRNRRNVEVWRLGSTLSSAETANEEGNALNLDSEPLKILQLEAKETIRCAAIASGGSSLAYATYSMLRSYKLDLQKPSLFKVPILGAEIGVIQHLGFHNNATLFAVSQSADFHLLNLENDTATNTSTISLHVETALKSGVANLAFNAFTVVMADFDGNVVTFNAKKRRQIAILPHYKEAVITCLNLDSDSNYVAITYANRRAVLCCAQSGCLLHTLSENLPHRFFNRKSPFRGIHLETDKWILYDDSEIAVVEKAPVKPTTPKSAKKGIKQMPAQSFTVTFKNQYRHLAHFERISSGCFVAVEVRQESFEEQMPPSIRLKKFGAM